MGNMAKQLSSRVILFTGIISMLHSSNALPGTTHLKCVTSSDCPNDGIPLEESSLVCGIKGICQCPDPKNQIYDKGIKKCKNLAGTTCLSNSESDKENPECVNNSECLDNVCTCSNGYTPYALSLCKADFLVSCKSSSDCDETRGLFCTPGGTCQCSGGTSYVPILGACFVNSTGQYLSQVVENVRESRIMEIFNLVSGYGGRSSPLSELYRYVSDDGRASINNNELYENDPYDGYQFAGQSILPSILPNPSSGANPQTGTNGLVSNFLTNLVGRVSQRIQGSQPSQAGNEGSINSIQDIIRSFGGNRSPPPSPQTPPPVNAFANPNLGLSNLFQNNQNNVNSSSSGFLSIRSAIRTFFDAVRRFFNTVLSFIPNLISNTGIIPSIRRAITGFLPMVQNAPMVTRQVIQGNTATLGLTESKPEKSNNLSPGTDDGQSSSSNEYPQINYLDRFLKLF